MSFVKTKRPLSQKSCSPGHFSLVEKLKVLLPSSEECEAVRPHAAKCLDVTDRLFKELSRLPFLENRLRVQSIFLDWDMAASELQRDVQIIVNAVADIMSPVSQPRPPSQSPLGASGDGRD